MARNSRTHVRTGYVAVMKAVKDNANAMMKIWHSRSYTFDSYIDETTGLRNSRQVPRPAEDYPENSVGEMNYAIDKIDEMIQGLYTLREFMVAERDALATSLTPVSRPILFTDAD